MSNRSMDAKIDSAFTLMAFTVNRFHINHMRRVASELGVGLESSYIWGILAHLNISASIYPGAIPENVLNENGHLKTHKRQPIRLTDLAQIASLPRETVRRKLLELQKLGKVERTPDGGWVASPAGVDEHIYEFTKETIALALQVGNDLQKLLQKSDVS